MLTKYLHEMKSGLKSHTCKILLNITEAKIFCNALLYIWMNCICILPSNNKRLNEFIIFKQWMARN